MVVLRVLGRIAGMALTGSLMGNPCVRWIEEHGPCAGSIRRRRGVREYFLVRGRGAGCVSGGGAADAGSGGVAEGRLEGLFELGGIVGGGVEGGFLDRGGLKRDFGLG